MKRAAPLRLLLLLPALAAAAHADPAPVQPPARFGDALERILQRSTGIAIRRSELEAQRARNVPARLFFLPTLTVSGSQLHEGTSRSSASTRTRLIEAEANLNLFRFGADVQAWRLASSLEEAQEALLADEILAAEGRGAGALFALIRRTQEAEIAARIVAMREEALQIARERYRRGLLPEQEAQKIEIDLENARARLSESQAQLALARGELLNQLGDAEVAPEWPWKESLAALHRSPEQWAALARASRPALQAASARAEAADRQASRAWRLALPSLDASFVDGYYWRPRTQQSEWTATLTLSWALFDRLSQVSEARARAQERLAAEQRLEQAAREERSDREALARQFGIALQSAIRREATLKTARKLYEDSLRRQRAGRSDANALTLDLDRLLDAELLAVQGWSEAHQSLTDLCHALGLRVAACLSGG